MPDTDKVESGNVQKIWKDESKMYKIYRRQNDYAVASTTFKIRWDLDDYQGHSTTNWYAFDCYTDVCEFLSQNGVEPLWGNDGHQTDVTIETTMMIPEFNIKPPVGWYSDDDRRRRHPELYDFGDDMTHQKKIDNRDERLSYIERVADTRQFDEPLKFSEETH